MDYIFSAEQIEVPKDLPGIMKAWTKEVIRYGPENVVSFSRDYFEACAQGASKRQAFLGKHEDLALAGAAGGSGTVVESRRASVAKRCPAVDNSQSKSSKGTLLDETDGVSLKTPTTAKEARGSLHDIQQHQSKQSPLKAADPVSSVSPADRKRAIYYKAFQKYDTNGDGTMDTGELKNLLSDLMWDNSDAALAKACSILDKDQNGTIDLDEFLDWTEYAWNFQAMASGSRKQSLSVNQSQQGLLPQKENKERRNSLLALVGEEEEEEGDEGDLEEDEQL